MSDHTRLGWLVTEPYHDVDHGVIKSGKEAQVNLIERIGADDRSCLIARKRYLPRHVTQKGQLEALGVQRASAFRHDVQYREGRQFRKSRAIAVRSSGCRPTASVCSRTGGPGPSTR